MFALIIALAVNPVTHQTTWEVYKSDFVSEVSCEQYVQQNPLELKEAGAKAYTCDTLKGIK